MNKIDFKTKTLEQMAQTVLMFTVSNLVTGSIVSRQFAPESSKEGDSVNCYFPAPYRTGHKEAARPVPTLLTDRQVVSFVLGLEDQSKSYTNLANEYFEPCGVALAEAVDQAILFHAVTKAGIVEGVPGTSIVDYLPDQLLPTKGLSSAREVKPKY